MKRGIKNLLLSLVGFSAAPMLTACYGTPYDDYNPMDEFSDIKGYVVDTEMKPINNIEVKVGEMVCRSGEDGAFLLDSEFYGNYTLTATDTDGEENGGNFGSVEVPITYQNHATVSVVMSKK